MKKFICATIALFLLAPFHFALAQAISGEAAVAAAEKFVVENGYTNAMSSRIKSQLNSESIEWVSDRIEMLRQRHNTLQPKAIGAKQGRRGSEHGWSIAFDHVSGTPGGRETCRVVTMDADGSNIRVEHVDGKRKFFAGFD